MGLSSLCANHIEKHPETDCLSVNGCYILWESDKVQDLTEERSLSDYSRQTDIFLTEVVKS